ncbi:hypothetical protein RCCS2_17806 [Roseobacter sp. CCS2]|nr:hypothetical protein RCCS2_17806 [Roseobacter sp. CCS2]
MLDVLKDLEAYSSKKGLHNSEDAIKEAYKQISTELVVERYSKQVYDDAVVDASDEMRRVLMFTRNFRGQLF